MRGFKSFPDRTRLDFERGITGIVGPNGSGKSNISDAVRWVLGEMSAKSMRGQKMEDVIFSGTEKRSQTGFCEVSLIIDNSDGTLDDEHEEVKITRRYSRDGESEYRLCDKAVRLKDIYELFLNTGIGREGYSVIGQGKIAEIISQKSDERRHIFEEAAGISKYRYRKNDAEKKLFETNANLLRVKDILTEVETRIGPLEKAAENAKKYLALEDRKKHLEVAVWIDRINKCAKEDEEYSAKVEKARENYSFKESQLSESEENLEKLYEEKQKISLHIESLRSEISKNEEEKNSIIQSCALSENDIGHYNDRKNAVDSEKKSILENIKLPLEKQLKEKTEKLYKSKDAADKEKQLLEEAEKEFANLEEKLKYCEAQSDSLKKEKTDNEEALLNIRIGFASLESDEKSENERRTFINDEIEKTAEEIKKLEEYLKVAEERKKSSVSEKEELESSLFQEEEKLKKTLQKHDELLRLKNELAAKFAANSHKKETLEKMDRLLEGYPGSVKAVMNNASLSGICGPVSKILSVSEEHVTAIETALGAAVANIVVETEQNAKDAIRYLKNSSSGRATFLPLTSIKGNVITEPGIERENGFVSIGSKLVSYNEKYRNIAEYLLGRTIVTENIDSASDIARKYRFRYRTVTLDGQIINSGGSYTGGTAASKSGTMSRNADIERLEKDLLLLEGKIKDISAGIKSAAEEKNDLMQYIESLKNDISNTGNEIYKCDKDIQTYLERLGLCNAKISGAKEQLQNKSENEAAEKIKALNSEREKLLEKKEKILKKIEENENEYDLLCEKFEKERRELEQRKINTVSVFKDYESAKQEVNAAEERLAEQNSKIALLEEEYSELENKLLQIGDALENGSEKIKIFEKQIGDLRRDFDKEIIKQTEYEKNINDIRKTQSDIIRDKETFFRELTKCESVLESGRKEYDTLTAKLFEEYELTYTEACALNYPAPDKTFVPELAQIKAKIRALGSVNVNAVEEYRETKERYEFLKGQSDDLEKSQRSLENIIKRLEADMKTIFAKAVEEINEKFKKVFSELFGGGSASIVMSDEENLLESGIEINVQPPGKMVKSISLLSGGEQAFTAIALYFAILLVNPAPFYIFDEIEAALDDINVHRFGQYLRRHSDETQFIVITHRRGSMEACDRLYGVTMQEKGISSFLKVDIDEVEKKTGLKL